MAKKKGDWWRIPAALIVAAVNIPIYWAGAVAQYFKKRWKK